MQWINHGETTVYENPWLTVNMADVELPDGRHLSHTVLREKPVALCAALNERREVLMLYRHRFIPDTWGWEVPGGGVDDGESLDEAAARELLEETGWKATGTLKHLLSVEPANGISDATYHLYWTDQVEHVGEPEDDFESARREWIPLVKVPEMIAAGEIRGADTVAGLLLLHHRMVGASEQAVDMANRLPSGRGSRPHI
ncbi:NUDIX hydrolase [Luteipulveratus mongoliensis]|uniref:NUDIX hydrolase n=1 Tax=Luteipulveratus mongoliensis TaxID=571913 RepID=UPI0009FA19A1|nr:NUDIX hydrolase [Luteipulveratus mongoliensis]